VATEGQTKTASAQSTNIMLQLSPVNWTNRHFFLCSLVSSKLRDHCTCNLDLGQDGTLPNIEYINFDIVLGELLW